MPFDFNNVKNLPSGQRNAKIISHQIRCYAPFYQLSEKRREAKEKGNFGLVFYYYFLERLFKAVAPGHMDEVPEHLMKMIDEPTDVIVGMEEIQKMDRAYNSEDVAKLTVVIPMLKNILAFKK